MKEKEVWEYGVGLKKQLDEGLAYYQNGGKMINGVDADKEIKNLLQASKKK